MPEQTTERKIPIRVENDLHRRLRICCAKRDAATQDFGAKLLDRELVNDGPVNRSGTPQEGQDR